MKEWSDKEGRIRTMTMRSERRSRSRRSSSPTVLFKKYILT